MTGTETDYIIVGGGPAGCVLASRLSEDPEVSVTLLEAGRADRNPLFRIPGLGFMLSRNPKNLWGFEAEPNPAQNDRKVAWLEGKVLGGSSSINGMMYTRGHAAEYDRWRQMGCEGWGYEDVLPHFRMIESSDRGDTTLHSTKGMMKIRSARTDLEICDALIAAFDEAGVPTATDLNDNVDEGFGYFDVNIDNGSRASAVAAYIKPARDRSNLTVRTGAYVERVSLDGGRATGVHFRTGAGEEHLSARREVILCAGAIKTPHILMLSGIGPQDQLEEFDIPVVVANDRVGENLQNHPAYRMQYACTESVTAYRHLKPANALREGLRYVFGRSGALGENIVVAGGFIRSNPALELADVQVVMTPTLVNGAARNLWEFLPKEEGFALAVYQGVPDSRGRLELSSSVASVPPRIVSNSLTDPRDMDVLCDAIDMIRDVMRREPIAHLIRDELEPGPDVTTREALVEEIRANSVTAFHQSGTCAMGPEGRSVVDPRLRVRGVRNLRVADTSIMPLVLNAGLHAPTLMIGEKAAAMIRGDWEQDLARSA